MEEADSSTKLAPDYQTTRCHTSEDSHLAYYQLLQLWLVICSQNSPDALYIEDYICQIATLIFLHACNDKLQNAPIILVTCVHLPTYM
jgi:hypothetical protein